MLLSAGDVGEAVAQIASGLAVMTSRREYVHRRLEADEECGTYEFLP